VDPDLAPPTLSLSRHDVLVVWRVGAEQGWQWGGQAGSPVPVAVDGGAGGGDEPQLDSPAVTAVSS